MPDWGTLKHTDLYTYSGRIAFPNGAPSLHDVAISLSREGRYAGAGQRWWPVVLHCFVVADLLPDRLKLHGLLHDASESIVGDVPKPVKTDAIEELEHAIQQKIYEELKLTPPTVSEHEEIKEADKKALYGEVYTVGTVALQALYPRCDAAEALVLKYLAEFPPLECLSADGRAPIEFMRRYRIYRDLYDVCRFLDSKA